MISGDFVIVLYVWGGLLIGICFGGMGDVIELYVVWFFFGVEW